MEKLKVTLAFQKTGINGRKPNIYERLIKWWTKSDYFHVEVIIGNTWISALDYRGFRMKQLRTLSDAYDYHTFYVDVTDKQNNDINAWLLEQVGKKYDWYGLVMSQIFKIGLDHDDKWICSEVATKVLQLLTVKKVFDLNPIMVAPGDLAKIFKVKNG